jgi:tetratricopeptide (TPR) repeat protein
LSYNENIVLQLDDDDSFEQGVLYNDQPLILYLSLTINNAKNLNDAGNLVIGTSDNPWYKQIKFYLNGKPSNVNFNILSFTPKQSVFDMHVDYSFLIEFGVDPELVGNIENGNQTLEAHIPSLNNSNELLKSNKITILKKNESLPQSLKKEPNMLRIAEYFLDRNNVEKAQLILNQLFNSNPTSVNVLFNLGRLEEIKEDKNKAQEYYLSALSEFNKQFPDDEEGPEIIITKILNMGGELPDSLDDEESV